MMGIGKTTKDVGLEHSVSPMKKANIEKCMQEAGRTTKNM